MARRTGELGPLVAKRLQKTLDDSGLSVANLADRSHVTRQTIYRILEGRGGNSSIGLIADLARALQVHPAWLAYGIGK